MTQTPKLFQNISQVTGSDVATGYIITSSRGRHSWGVSSHPHGSPLPPCCQTSVLTDGELECVQIQTVKTQEMNLLREQQEALTAELSQRRAEYEALSAQRDDLASQLQVSAPPTPYTQTHTHSVMVRAPEGL